MRQASNREQSSLVSVVCFAIIMLICVGTTGFAFGRISVEPERVEVYASYHTGPVNPGVPIMAVYTRHGVIDSISAIATDDGRLYEFSIHGEPVSGELLPEPEAWTELSAGILEVLE